MPTRLIRLRASPCPCKPTTTSDSNDSDSSGSDCSLDIPAGANVNYSQRGGKPSLQVKSGPGPPSNLEQDPKSEITHVARVQARISILPFLYPLCI